MYYKTHFEITKDFYALTISRKGSFNLYALLHSKSTRSGFAHMASVALSIPEHGSNYSHKKINYCNRTWENYRFQTVLMSAVNEAIKTARIDEHAAATIRHAIDREAAKVILY